MRRLLSRACAALFLSAACVLAVLWAVNYFPTL